MRETLEQCLSRVPEAEAVVCAGVQTGALIGEARAGEAAGASDGERLATSAAVLFRGDVIAQPDRPGGDDTLSEAVVAGPQSALIFLRCPNRVDAAVVYSIGRGADLGLALARSRQTLPDIEAAI